MKKASMLMIPTPRMSFAVAAVAVLLACGCSSPDGVAPATPEGPCICYAITGTTVAIDAAATPFDGRSGEREAFLHWFGKGVETGHAGSEPLMIEWMDTPEGRAGRCGYDAGLEEGGRIRKAGRASGTWRQDGKVLR